MNTTHARVQELEPGNDEDLLREFRRDFCAGMLGPQKGIPSKWLYDARGSVLFEEICRQPEYYPTRTEMRILAERAREIADLAGPGCALVELGSGSSRKTHQLLNTLRQVAAYVPIDIAASALHDAAAVLSRRFPGLDVAPTCGDFTRCDWTFPEAAATARRRLHFFPGSTIGNFTRSEAVLFLRGLARRCVPGDALLVGVDLVKDVATVEAAYNDRAGVTAAFNLNILDRANRELGTGFIPTQFRHRAVYVPEHARIEMHLVSQVPHGVPFGDARIAFRRDEWITTEYSHKYDVEGFRELARRGGFTPVAAWVDDQALFSVHWLQVR